jgi:hypothetical protein
MSLFRRGGPESGSYREQAPNGLKVVGLHQLEFSDADVNAELDAMRITDPEEREELFSQYSENYRNAWLVVLEFDGEADALDFGRFSYGATPDSPYNQAAWEETILVSDGGRTEAAFYLHYLQPEQALWYEKARLSLPQPAPASPGLFEKAPYSSPD